MVRYCVYTFLLFLFVSCATIRSGQYVQILQGENLSKLAKKYDVPAWAIEGSNPKSKFRAGEWVFIPLNIGVLTAGNVHGVPSRSYLKAKGFLWPVPAGRSISSEFGKRWGKHHEGIDIPAPRGSHILATSDGLVVYAGKMGGYGNIIVLGHANGIFSVYAHNKRNFVSKGQGVHKGQVIGQVGSTGRSTGPHLHFELRQDSKAMDPKDFLVKR